MKEWTLTKLIAGVLPPLKQKINNQVKVEASTVADMWDPQLACDIFHRCYRNIQKEKKAVKPNAGSFEVQVHEFINVEDIPSKGISLRALKTFIYCSPEQEVLDCLYLCDKRT
ncbi:hypothetical protein EMCRGX_G001017 [Ephydatia muelleri]